LQGAHKWHRENLPLCYDVFVVTSHKKIASYEPVFGGLAATLAAVFLCFVLLSPTQPHQSHTGTAYLIVMSCSIIGWGIGQVLGYRRAQRDHIALSPPTVNAGRKPLIYGGSKLHT
jgi:hypothetical protein